MGARSEWLEEELRPREGDDKIGLGRARMTGEAQQQSLAQRDGG